ncbi:MAG: hypothetical protein JWM07_739 [Candidatus Saccharibacteria bacterium]|nr:hypothetical protein [Candidatus Saccharibacteria bacterium]
MPAFYRKLKSLLAIQLFWSLDYAYLFRKQLFGAIACSKPERYRKANTNNPSIILIPGIYERWQFMKPVATLLYRHNYDVHVIEGLGYNRHSVEDMAEIVRTYIESGELKAYVLIAHSKGGLIGKYLLANYNADHKIKKLIALNTPFSGSRYAYLFLLIKSLRMFIPNSSILKSLSKNQSVNQSIVSIYGKFDPHIPGGSRLEGAKNIQLDTHGHFRIMNDRVVHQAILKELEQIDN